MLCRESKDFLPKIADVLSQLLQTQDSSELSVIQNSLMSLFRKEAKGRYNYVIEIFLQDFAYKNRG